MGFFLDADCLINPSSFNILQFKNKNVVYIAQTLPLTQFNYNLKQHVPTYFFGLNKKNYNLFNLPSNVNEHERFVNHKDYERRLYLLDDLFFNINLSVLNNVVLKQTNNLIAHLGKEKCTINEKINFLKFNINLIKQQQLKFNYE